VIGRRPALLRGRHFEDAIILLDVRRYLRYSLTYRDLEEIMAERSHRFIKKRITVSFGFRSVEGAWRTIEGYEAMHAIRKGQVRWVAKGDPVGQRQFIHTIFSVAA
jgi:transposase-like protein